MRIALTAHTYYTHGWFDKVLIVLLVALLVRAAFWKGGDGSAD